MSGDEAAGAEAGARFAVAHRAEGRIHAIRPPGLGRGKAREKSSRLVVVSSLFLLLIAVALVTGGHDAVDPLIQTVIAARESKGVGDVVLTMPDGVYCRHMSFDNATGEVVESSMEPCDFDAAGGRSHVEHRFSWRAR